MGYERRPDVAEGWSYDGLEIQADVATHHFTVAYAREHLAAGARVLDVGAGTGALAKQLADAGFDVSCTSWDGRVRAALPVFTVDLDVPFGTETVGGSYDLVCCLEVIEHVENPSALIRSLREIVKPGGRVIVSTPNVESAQARLQTFTRGCPLIFSGNEVTRNRHISMLWGEGLAFLFRCGGFDIERKVLIGAPRLRGTAQRFLKTPVYWAMSRLLRGDLGGETRMYALIPARPPRKAGAADVY